MQISNHNHNVNFSIEAMMNFDKTTVYLALKLFAAKSKILILRHLYSEYDNGKHHEDYRYFTDETHLTTDASVFETSLAAVDEHPEIKLSTQEEIPEEELQMQREESAPRQLSLPDTDERLSQTAPTPPPRSCRLPTKRASQPECYVLNLIQRFPKRASMQYARFVQNF